MSILLGIALFGIALAGVLFVFGWVRPVAWRERWWVLYRKPGEPNTARWRRVAWTLLLGIAAVVGTASFAVGVLGELGNWKPSVLQRVALVSVGLLVAVAAGLGGLRLNPHWRTNIK